MLHTAVAEHGPGHIVGVDELPLADADGTGVRGVAFFDETYV